MIPEAVGPTEVKVRELGAATVLASAIVVAGFCVAVALLAPTMRMDVILGLGLVCAVVVWAICRPAQVTVVTKTIAQTVVDSLEDDDEDEDKEEEPEEPEPRECGMCGTDLEEYDHELLCGDCKAKVDHYAPRLGYVKEED